MRDTVDSMQEGAGLRRERWLLLRYHALGDVVLSTGVAAFAALRGGDGLPVDLDVAVDRRFQPVYEGNPHVRHVLDRRDLEERPDRVRYDRVLDLQGTAGSRALASRLSGSVRTVRTRPASRRWIVFWGDRFPRPSIPHCLERYGEMLPGRPCADDLAPRLWVTGGEEIQAGREAPGVFDSAPGRAVILLPGASRRSKEYGRFDEVCRGLRSAGRPVWWVVAPGAPDPPVDAGPDNLILRVGLGSLKAVCSRAAAAVACDSGPMHLAQGIGLPVAAIFCSSVAAFGFAPTGGDAGLMQPEDLACRPCGVHGRNHCWLGHWRCVRDIEPGLIVRETLRLIEESRRSEDRSGWTSG